MSNSFDPDQARRVVKHDLVQTVFKNYVPIIYLLAQCMGPQGRVENLTET